MASYPATALAVVFLAGLLVGGGVVAFALPTDTSTSPTSSMSAATGCLGANQTAPASWLVRMPAGDRTSFGFNRTFTHDEPGVRIDSAVESPEPGVYVYRFSTSPDETAKPASDDCTPRTTMDAVASVPSDYRTFTVVFDGEELVTVENDGWTPLYRTVEG